MVEEEERCSWKGEMRGEEEWKEEDVRRGEEEGGDGAKGQNHAPH